MNMFGWALPKAAASHMKSAIEERLVYPDRPLTSDDIDATILECLDEAETSSAAQHLKQKNRAIDLQYRGYTVTLRVSSISEEVSLRLYGWIKNTNVGCDLKPMSWEGLLVDAADGAALSAKPQRGLCSPEVLASLQRARDSVDSYLLLQEDCWATDPWHWLKGSAGHCERTLGKTGPDIRVRTGRKPRESA